MPALRLSETGEILVPTVRILGGWFERGIGLLGRRRLPDGQAWYFPRCSAIHTFGMRFPLDLLFIDKDGCVLRAESNVGPWRTIIQRGAIGVLEMQSGWLVLPKAGQHVQVS